MFLFPFQIFFGELCSLVKGMVSYFSVLLGMLVAKREPTPCYRDAYSVDTPKWAFWEKGWLTHYTTTFPPCLDVFTWLAIDCLSFFWRVIV